MGHERLWERPPAAHELVLVREVCVELREKLLAGDLEAPLVGQVHAGAGHAGRGVDPGKGGQAVHLGAPGLAMSALIVLGGNALQLGGAGRPLHGVGEKLLVGHLEHAVGKRAHLRPSEPRVSVPEPQAPQAEPLVRALQVCLDLRGRQERPGVLDGHALGGRP